MQGPFVGVQVLLGKQGSLTGSFVKKREISYPITEAGYDAYAQSWRWSLMAAAPAARECERKGRGDGGGKRASTCERERVGEGSTVDISEIYHVSES